MGIISKEGYESKARYAAKRMAANKEIETLTEEQHDALSWLCSVRHELHSNKDSFFISESSDSGKLYDYIDFEINQKLSECELPKINWSVPAFQITTDTDFYYNIPESEQNDDKYFELKSECYEQLEEINKDIEKYLRKVDEEHKTNYCPTGASRIF